ncbi:MAG: FecCD family ABC transporter permease [Lachnospirales bacterium]
MNKDKDVKSSLFIFILIGLFLLICFSICFSVSVGQVEIPLRESYTIIINKLSNGQLGDLTNIGQNYINIIWQIRFPRVLMAILIGAGLAISGTVMQATVQNPLADPYLLGISSGASLGATFSILIGFGSFGMFSNLGVSFGAFLGAFVASMLVLTLSSLGGKMTSIKLVLSGMVVNALFSAFSNFIVYFANDAEGIKSVTFWTMGSLASASWEDLPLVLFVVLFASFIFIIQSRILNTMLLGDETAITLGIDLSKYRAIYMIFTSLLTGILVASCGMIGFVGLIIPHVVRGFVGADHRKLIPIVILCGGLFLIWCDVFSRIIIDNSELPIGIITSMIGAPMFIYMLIKKGYGFGSK